jgi:CheY-like chemotaxis protein
VPAMPPPMRPSIPRGNGERILFIDDEQTVGDPVCELLDRIGYRVTFELDPRSALKLFQEEPDAFDLVLTDLAMPGMTGSELAKAVQSLRPDVPIILLTGWIESRQREQLLHDGIRAVLAKPASLGDLATAIASSLRQPR